MKKLFYVVLLLVFSATFLFSQKNTDEIKSKILGFGHLKDIAFSPDGKKIANCSAAGFITIWNTQTGEIESQIFADLHPILCISFSPDGRYLASGSWDNTIKLWEVKSGKELRTFSGHTFTVTSVSFSPDGRQLASGSWDGTVRIWYLEELPATYEVKEEEPEASIPISLSLRIYTQELIRNIQKNTEKTELLNCLGVSILAGSRITITPLSVGSPNISGVDLQFTIFKSIKNFFTKAYIF